MGNYEFDVDQTVGSSKWIRSHLRRRDWTHLSIKHRRGRGATTVVTAVRNDTGSVIPAGAILYSLGDGTDLKTLVGVADASVQVRYCDSSN